MNFLQLSSEHIYSVRNSWRYFKHMDSQLLGEVFYTKLITDHPTIKKMLHRNMVQHYTNLHEFLNTVVARIDRTESLKQALAELSHQWQLQEFQEIHFSWIGDSLIWTLSKGLGNQWTTETEMAWRQYYRVLIFNLLKINQPVH